MAAVKKGQIIEADIDTMAFGGRGIAKIDGFCVFIDQAVAGDRVRALVQRKKKNFAEGRIVEILRPSPLRVDPPCPYAGHCGGCKWQHIDYGHQLAFKRAQVQEAIAHIGGIGDVHVRPAIPSEKVFAYRNKMEFTCSDRRWLMPAEMNREELDRTFALGLHVPGTFDKVLDIERCLLQPHRGNDLLGYMRKRMKASGRRPYGLKSHDGFWRFIMLRHAVRHDAWMVNMVTREEDPRLLKDMARDLMSSFPDVISVVNNVTSRKAGIAVGEYEVHLAGEPVLRDQIGPYGFEISSNSFFQTNTRGAETLYQTVEELAELSGRETVVDLYSGTGTIAIFLARKATRVTGFEISESAVRDANRNCLSNGIDNCLFVPGDIRQSIDQIQEVPDVLVLDPPRAGMHKDVLKQVVAMGSNKIVYVSCNPATMARDLDLMKDVYRIPVAQPVDMFPHTHHIETVARLEKR